MPEKLRSPEIVKSIKKLFIANHGEIAIRAIKECIRRGVPAVIPYSLLDPYTLATRMAEEQGWELAPLAGSSPEDSYSDQTKILEEARSRKCDAIFLGYGHLSENAEFVKKCEDAGIRVLAPPSEIMELTGNKIKAREAAEKLHIPVLKGTKNLPSFKDAVNAASKLKFPVMLKDPDTGGGMGNLVAKNDKELEAAYTKLKSRPGNKEIFMEQYVENAAHIEVQIAGDKYGNAVSLGVRDCTAQRNYQKVVEESPSPHVNDETSEAMQKAAIKFAQRIGYSGVGTWEFIVDLKNKDKKGKPRWYFMEVNPRVQVEHGVTEEQTGINIVGLMMDIAEGRRLSFSQKDIRQKGHTIEVRVYGENPDKEFELSPGKISMLEIPKIDNVRVDQGAEQGDEILSEFQNPTILKAIAHGETREEAINSLIGFLKKLKIEGVSSNKEFLIEFLNTPEFRSGKITTTFIEKWWKQKEQDRFQGLSEFTNGGTFTTISPSRKLDVSLLPQDVKVVSRRSPEPIPYSQYRKEQKERAGKEDVNNAEFGILKRDGVQLMLYHLNGTLGVEEGIAFRNACEIAYKKKLPLVTIVTSGGADQRQNSIALTQMGATISALNNYPPPIHINIYTGGVYGGVPASFAGTADIQVAIDSSETNIGFTGPFIVAKTMGRDPKSSSKEHSYPELPEGTHTPMQDFQSRNVDMLEPSLKSASDKIVHLLHLLELPGTITDSLKSYHPIENTSSREYSSKGKRFDRPGQHFVAWTREKTTGILWEMHNKKYPSKGEIILPPRYENLTISERLDILGNAERPTAADYINVKSDLFEDSILLSNQMTIEGVNQYPPIIAALAKINGEKVLILAHQTQIVTSDKGEKTKVYDPQKPEDWEYAQRMISVAKKLKFPIILLGDTAGADSLPESETRNQSHKIAGILQSLDSHPHPILSVNIGIKGSGGGETFIRPFDGAADLGNALSFVSAPMVQYWILTGKWIDKNSPDEQKKELEDFIEQLKDATAEGRLATRQIDAIIPEGKGGAHADPSISVNYLRSWIIDELKKLKKTSPKNLLKSRKERLERVTDLVTTSNSK